MRNIHLLAGIVVLGGAAALTACRESRPHNTDTTRVATLCGPGTRAVVEELGHRMRRVSLLAPDTLVRRSLSDAYASVVTAALLESWQASPMMAPGREVSSPWPARIAITSMTTEGNTCRVDGEVVYVTSGDTIAPAEGHPVTLRVISDSGWRVSSYETPAPSAKGTSATSTQPADVVQRYYDAIEAKDFAAAYALWGEDGKASGQSLQQFAAGFANTTRVRATIGDSVRLGAAAGSQYATVPVTIDATLRDGRRQHFTGTYTVRRAMVDGATAAQRRWHIYKADLHGG